MDAPARSITLEPIDPLLVDELTDRLADLTADVDLCFKREHLESCVRHLLYVEQVNRYINLTRITDLDDALVLHILDSLLLLPFIPDSDRKVLDMGTGAGYPGIPLAACSDLEFTLLDSVGKKVNACNAFIHELGIRNAVAFHDRIESFAASHRGQFDCVIARALASMPVLLEYARPYLHVGGCVVLAKGVPDDREIDDALSVAELLGYAPVEHVSFDLPYGLGSRSVYTFEVTVKSSVKLPRPNGEARRKPLV